MHGDFVHDIPVYGMAISSGVKCFWGMLVVKGLARSTLSIDITISSMMSSILIICLGSCEAGEQPMSDQSGCEPCPQGSYQPEPNQQQCETCDPDTSTLMEGAVNETACTGMIDSIIRSC